MTSNPLLFLLVYILLTIGIGAAKRDDDWLADTCIVLGMFTSLTDVFLRYRRERDAG